MKVSSRGNLAAAGEWIYKKYSHFSRRSDGDAGDSANKKVLENCQCCPIMRTQRIS